MEVDHQPSEKLQKCSELSEEFISCVSEITSKFSEQESDSFQDLVSDASMYFLDLKDLHRGLYEEYKEYKDKVEQKRKQVDQRHLVLQNLLYEKLHLLREIESCNEFVHRPQDVELLSEAEFYETAPHNLKQVNENDEHQLMTNRLTHERFQRIMLSEELIKLEENKKEIEETINKQGKVHSNLQGELAQVLKKCQEIRNSLSIDFSSTAKTTEDLPLQLPSPLYSLYCIVKAYQQSFAVDLKCEVLGDLKEAKKFNDVGIKETQPSGDTKNQKARKNWIMKPHPLSVKLCVDNDFKGKPYIIIFKYLVHLDIVCVQAISGGNSVSTDNSRVLCELYQNDDGECSPNFQNNYQLESSGISNFSEISKLHGLSFRWAQKCCGLDHLPQTEQQVLKISEREQRQYFSQLMLLIKRRLKSKACLDSELNALKKCKLDLGRLNSDILARLFPISGTACLSGWVLQEENVKFKLFSFAITKPKASTTMRGIVKISTMYPLEPPEFKITSCPNIGLDNDFSAEVIEKEVNLYYDELIENFPTSDYLLTMQLKKLEIIFEYHTQLSQSTSRKTTIFGKICSRMSRGPLREPPSVVDYDTHMLIAREKT